MKLTIGLSYAPEDNLKYNRYRDAVVRAGAEGGYEMETIELWHHPERVAELDGILFTGGADIDPVRYGKEAERHLCGTIDETRDGIEFSLADEAERLGLPTLGICRGTQLLNVHRGGTLVTDIESFGGRDHKGIGDADSRHRVTIAPGSFLSKMLGTREGEINSSHHQAVERPGEGYAVSARAAEDGIIEALEWADATGKPFFLAVQWHPERMQWDEKLAGRLFETFVWEVAAHKTLKARTGPLGNTRESAPSV